MMIVKHERSNMKIMHLKKDVGCCVGRVEIQIEI